MPFYVSWYCENFYDKFRNAEQPHWWLGLRGLASLLENANLAQNGALESWALQFSFEPLPVQINQHFPTREEFNVLPEMVTLLWPQQDICCVHSSKCNVWMLPRHFCFCCTLLLCKCTGAVMACLLLRPLPHCSAIHPWFLSKHRCLQHQPMVSSTLTEKSWLGPDYTQRLWLWESFSLREKVLRYISVY